MPAHGKYADLAFGWKSASPRDPCYGIGFSETKKGDGRRDTHWRALEHWEVGFSTSPKKITPPSSSKVYGSWTDTVDVWIKFSFLWQMWGWCYEGKKRAGSVSRFGLHNAFHCKGYQGLVVWKELFGNTAGKFLKVQASYFACAMEIWTQFCHTREGRYAGRIRVNMVRQLEPCSCWLTSLLLVRMDGE